MPRQIQPDLLLWPPLFFKNCEQSMGVRVKDTQRLMKMAKATVAPKLLKNFPTRPPMNTTGRKMTKSDMVVAITARAISLVAEEAAVRASTLSSSMCRKMFSLITTASSITMPMANIRPNMVMLLSV